MNKLLIIDSNNMAQRHSRAYHLTDPKGNDVSIVFGMLKSLNRLIAQFNADAICLCWDSGKSPRRKMVSEIYKGNRSPISDADKLIYADRKRQMNDAYDILKFIPVLQLKDFDNPTEADDMVAVVALMSKCETIIVSSDKDYLQLIDDRIKMYSPIKDILVGLDNFENYCGVKRENFIDYMVLIGDAADNIPGITGIGQKSAMILLEKYGSIEKIMDNVEELSKKNRFRCLATESNKIEINKQLIDFDYAVKDIENRTVELIKNYSIPECANEIELHNKFIEYGFVSMLLDINRYINNFNRLSNRLEGINAEISKEEMPNR